MGWSFHCVPLQKAVDEGIVERINKKTGRNESREALPARFRAECIDEEQWLQEYCCIPADENAAFFSHQMLDACTDPSLRLLTLDELLHSLTFHVSRFTENASPSQLSTINSKNYQLFLGLDIARKRNLCVLDVGEKVGSVIYDRLRLELHDKSFTEIESNLYPLLRLPQLKRACIDESGIVRADHQLSDDQREQIASALRQRKRRAGSADRSILLWGATEIVKPTLSSADLQFLENRKFSRAEICAAFGVPEEIVATSDHNKYDVMQGARLNFIENRIAPLCARLEAEENATTIPALLGASLNSQLSTINSPVIGWFDLDSLPIMQQARRARLAAARVAFELGIPLNELNRLLDLGVKPLPWGDIGYVPSTLQPVSDSSGAGVPPAGRGAGVSPAGSGGVPPPASCSHQTENPIQQMHNLLSQIQNSHSPLHRLQHLLFGPQPPIEPGSAEQTP